MGGLIIVTFLLVLVFGCLLVKDAWNYGGEFYTVGNITKRKSWFKRLLDGFEILDRM